MFVNDLGLIAETKIGVIVPESVCQFAPKQYPIKNKQCYYILIILIPLHLKFNQSNNLKLENILFM
jgi:hypothetical protein